LAIGRNREQLGLVGPVQSIGPGKEKWVEGEREERGTLMYRLG
jgi:hypothetical protein